MKEEDQNSVASLVKKSFGFIDEANAKKCLAFIAKHKSNWTEQLSELPPEEKILFIEDKNLSSKIVVLPSQKENSLPEIYLLIHKLGSNRNEKKQNKLSFFAWHVEKQLPIAFHMGLLSESNDKAVKLLHEIDCLKEWNTTTHMVKTFRIYPFVKEKDKGVIIIQKYYTLGNVRNYHQNHELSYIDSLWILHDVLSALVTLHEKGWAHGRIDEYYIFLTKIKSDAGPRLSATLGGLNRMIPPKSKNSPAFLEIPSVKDPPEYFYYAYFQGKRFEQLGPPWDMWRLGIFILRIFLRIKLKWAALKNPLKVIQGLENIENLFSVNEDASSLEQLAKKMLKSKPNDRISSEEALKEVNRLIQSELKRVGK